MAEPLARTFLLAAQALIEPMHTRMGERGWQGIRPMWGFVLVTLRDGSCSVTELGTLLGVSKQAAAKAADSLVAAGLVDDHDDPSDGRVRRLALTADGARFLADVEEIYAELESEWTAVIGVRRLDQMRHDLAAILDARFGDDRPPIRPLL